MDVINKIVDLTDLNDKKYQFYVDMIHTVRGFYKSTNRSFYAKLCGNMRVWEYAHLLVNTINPFECAEQIVLDAGCSSTLFAGLLSVLYKRVYGIDKDEKQIEIAKSIVQDLEMDNIEHCCGDISDMPQYSDRMFDRVYSVCVIEHLVGDSQQKALSEWVRVLRCGGILGFTFDFGKLKSEQGFFDEEDVNERLIKPLEDQDMRLLGNRKFQGASKEERANKKFFTFGCLFFEKGREWRSK